MTKKVLLLLADGFEALEAAGFTDVFSWAAIDGSVGIELVSAGLRTPLRTTFGFSVIPQKLVSELDLSEFDALAVPGGFDGARNGNRSRPTIARQADQRPERVTHPKNYARAGTQPRLADKPAGRNHVNREGINNLDRRFQVRA